MSAHALITGGQQGIGLGIALALRDAGFAISIAAQLPGDDPIVIDALKQLGSSAHYHQHDLLDIAKVATLMDMVEAQTGPVHSFISNAGVPAKTRGDMLDIAPDNFDFVMDINLRGAFFLAQEVARRMQATPSDIYRSMIFVTSVSAELASIERAEYCLSKAAAAMMVKLFAVRMAPLGIGAFEVRPGIIDTAMTASVKDTYTPRIENGLVPAKRWGYPGDIGKAIVPLANGQMAFSNGAIIPVDGGLSLTQL